MVSKPETCSICGSSLHSSSWCPSQKEGQVCPGFNDLNQNVPGPEPDPHSGPHKCSKCGSNNHPTKWCPCKDDLQPISTFDAPVCHYQVFAAFDIPSGPPLTTAPVDQAKPAKCSYWTSTEHTSITCPAKTQLESWRQDRTMGEMGRSSCMD